MVTPALGVRAVVIDPQDRLWILDTGSINMQPIKPGAPKLVCYDLNTNKLIKRINFPESVALPTTSSQCQSNNSRVGHDAQWFDSELPRI